MRRSPSLPLPRPGDLSIPCRAPLVRHDSLFWWGALGLMEDKTAGQGANRGGDLGVVLP
jgi:hypothetical protein